MTLMDSHFLFASMQGITLEYLLGLGLGLGLQLGLGLG